MLLASLTSLSKCYLHNFCVKVYQYHLWSQDLLTKTPPSTRILLQSIFSVSHLDPYSLAQSCLSILFLTMVLSEAFLTRSQMQKSTYLCYARSVQYSQKLAHDYHVHLRCWCFCYENDYEYDQQILSSTECFGGSVQHGSSCGIYEGSMSTSQARRNTPQLPFSFVLYLQTCVQLPGAVSNNHCDLFNSLPIGQFLDSYQDFGFLVQRRDSRAL